MSIVQVPGLAPGSTTLVTSARKFPKQTIGPQFTNKVLPWFETFYFKHKRYPRPEEIIAHFTLWTLEQVELLNLSPFWLKCLERRGIASPVARTLSPTQVAAASLITNFSDKRSVNSKMASIGVTTEQLNGWYQNPSFTQELQIRTDSALENSFPEIQAALIRQAGSGNVPAIKFIYEVTGKVQTPEQINLKLTVSRLIEAVQRHVHDPEVLRAIAADVQLANSSSNSAD